MEGNKSVHTTELVFVGALNWTICIVLQICLLARLVRWLKTKDSQFDNIVITGGTASCHCDNLQGSTLTF